MSDETSQAIFGDAVADSLERPGRHGAVFSAGKRQPKRSRPSPTAKIAARNCTDTTARNAAKWRSITGAPFATSSPTSRNRFSIGIPNSPRRIGLLLLSPGWLTNQFVAGRRTRYLHPLRLYLLVSIVFFLCARFLPISPGRVHGPMSPADRAEVEKAMSDPNMPAAVREQVRAGVGERGGRARDERSRFLRRARASDPAARARSVLENIHALPGADDATLEQLAETAGERKGRPARKQRAARSATRCATTSRP